MTGTAPAELISVMAAAHRAFEPRTSDEGRRPRSIRAAILSTPSKAPLTTTSRRTRGPSSFHLFLATRTPCAVISPAASGPARDPARDPFADDSVGQAGGRGVQRGHPLVAHAAGGRTDVEVQPVLGGLALRHPLEEQPRPGLTLRRQCGGAAVVLLGRDRPGRCVDVRTDLKEQ